VLSAQNTVTNAIQLMGLRKDDIVYELGCGATVQIEAIKQHKVKAIYVANDLARVELHEVLLRR